MLHTRLKLCVGIVRYDFAIDVSTASQCGHSAVDVAA